MSLLYIQFSVKWISAEKKCIAPNHQSHLLNDYLPVKKENNTFFWCFDFCFEAKENGM